MEAGREVNITNVKTHIAEIIINFNFTEQRINEIIEEYIDSRAEYFINNILLSSLILNVGAKVKILNYIVVTEAIDLPKEWMNPFHMLMKNRNLIAHSDNLLAFDQDLEDLEFVYNNETGEADPSPTWIEVPPYIPIFDKGKVNYVEISMILDEFDKYYARVDESLKIILDTVSRRHAKPFPDAKFGPKKNPKRFQGPSSEAEEALDLDDFKKENRGHEESEPL
ncbi:hypothetical protein [Dyadobacter sp. NIV53]|uniref:hypothetical protein n=1 Tax=Dyadobacter sp. NIV53 TaxID=2861765 RepID=UPI001C87C3D4|nr:hypothetical protein [Dyadobacter sp. NIV53]